HLADADAQPLDQFGELRPLEHHADRAGDGVAARHDVVGGECRDVATGCRHRPHHGNHRLLGGDLADRLVQRLGAGGGAAGAVDPEDQRLRPVGAGDPVQQLLLAAVVGDDAIDGDPRDVVAEPEPGVAAAGDRDPQHHRHRDGGDAEHPPQPEAPLQAPAVGQEIGVERHARQPPAGAMQPAAGTREPACSARGRGIGMVTPARRSPVAYPAVGGGPAGRAGRYSVLSSDAAGSSSAASPSSPSPASLSSLSAAACASFCARFSAAPRISPSEAPESVEPYWATASFSSAISSALIETVILRVFLSNWVTRASTFCPTAKRSGRCSSRSRERSERLMNVSRSWSTRRTSMPPSLMAVTSQVTTAFLRSSPGATASPTASRPSCLMPGEMRSFSMSTSRTCAFTMAPRLYPSITCSPGRVQSRSERWTMPSTSPSRPMNRPNSVLFLTSPSTTEPTGWLRAKASHGFSSVCLRPSEMRRLTGSTSRMTTSTSCVVDRILPG